MFKKDNKMLINIEEALNLMWLREKEAFSARENKLGLTNAQRKLKISDKETVRKESPV